MLLLGKNEKAESEVSLSTHTLNGLHVLARERKVASTSRAGDLTSSLHRLGPDSSRVVMQLP
jgi:hypothetical protein